MYRRKFYLTSRHSPGCAAVDERIRGLEGEPPARETEGIAGVAPGIEIRGEAMALYRKGDLNDNKVKREIQLLKLG